MKKIFIIFGGGGFIGSNIYNNLLDKDNYFLIIDKNFQVKQFPSKKDIWAKFGNNFCGANNINLDYKNYNDEEFIISFIKKEISEIVKKHGKSIEFELNFMHLASTVGVNNNFKSNFEEDVNITQNIINITRSVIDYFCSKAIIFNGIRIWYTSSSELYGENCHLIHSEKPNDNLKDLSCLYDLNHQKRSHYIYQKYIGEQLMKYFVEQLEHKYSGILITLNTLVLFNAVGPGQDPEKGVFNKFILGILKGEIVNGSSDSIRRYVPIYELVNHIIKLRMPLIARTDYIKGTSEYLACTAMELFDYIKVYLLKLYPNNINIQASKIIDNKDYLIGSKEIKKRFSKQLITDREFNETYGDIIKEQIEIFIQNGIITKEELEDNYIQIKNSDDFDCYIISVNNEYGLVGLLNYDSKPYENLNIGKLVNFENGGVGLISGINHDLIANKYYYNVVILGKMFKNNEPIYKQNIRCKISEKLLLSGDNYPIGNEA